MNDDRIERIGSVRHPNPSDDHSPGELTALKARLVQRTIARYRRGLKRLGE